MRSVLLIALFTMTSLITAQDYPRWLGPQGTGVVSTATTIRSTFDGEVKPLWSIAFPKNSKVQASPVIVDDQAYYLTVVYDKRKGEQIMFTKSKEWEKKYKKSLSKDGATFIEKLVASSQIRWKDKAEFDQWLQKAPLTDNEKLAVSEGLTDTVPHSINSFHAVAVETGKELWSAQWEGGKGPLWGGTHATPLVADGTVYVVDGGGITHAFATSDGSRKWQAKEAVWGRYAGANASPILHDGRLILMRQTGVIALSAADGSLLWDANNSDKNNLRATEDNTATIYTSPKGDVILAGGLGSKGDAPVHALDPKTGKTLWKVDNASHRYTTPVVVGDIMITQLTNISKNFGTHAFDLSSQPAKKLWYVRLAVPPKSKPSQTCSTPAANKEWVWWGHANNMRCMSITDGSIRWEKDYVVNDFSSPVLCGDILILLMQSSGRNKKNLTWNLVKADTGDIVHSQEMDSKKLGRICSTPAIANGRLFIRGAASLVCWDLRP